MTTKKKSEKPKYLFHGSPKRLNILLPHHARSEIAQDSELGIYASEYRGVAMAHALVIPDRNGGAGWSEKITNDGKVNIIVHHGKICKKGYLYKVSSNSFQQNSFGEWVSKTVIRPIEIKEIHVRDCSHIIRYDYTK